MTERRLRAAAAALALTVLAAAGAAAEEGATPTLRQPEPGTAAAPTVRIEIHVPPAIPVERLSRWTLELDGIDVTALVSREGELALVDPPQTLAPGRHTLRIVETTPAGALEELASWRFRVVPADEEGGLRFEGSADATGGALIAHNNTGDEPGRGTGQGSGFAAVEGGGQGWSVRAEGDAVFDTEQRLTPNGTVGDIDEFLFSGTAWNDAGSATVTAGHTTPGTGSMIMAQPYNRRGLALTLSDIDERVTLRPFAVRTERIGGVRHGLGISDPDNRTVGGTAVVRPLSDPDALTVQATVLTGQGRSGGLGQASPLDVDVGGLATDDAGEGTAGSLRVDSTLFDRHVSVGAEYAATSYDPGAGASAERSQGYRVELGYDSHPGGALPEQGPAWSVSAAHERRGLFFRSPAEELAGQDFEETRLSGRLAWPSFELGATASQIVDNVEDKAFLPTVRSRGARLDAYWSPHAADPDAEPGWFGTPAFRAAAEIYQDLQVDTPPAYAFDPVNRLERAGELGATFTYSGWSWDVSHRIAYLGDRTPIGDRLVNYSQLTMNFPLGDRVFVSPYLQYSTDRNQTTGVDQDSLNGGITASAVIVPRALDFDVSYAYDASAASNGTVDFAIHTVESSLNWRIAEPDGYMPGVTFSIRGAYNHSDERGTSVAEGHSYEVFGVFSVGLEGPR